MNLRRCQALNTNGDNPIEFEGYFHCWHVVEGEKFSLIEDDDGHIHVWDTNIQFLEPARQRVEVTAHQKPTQTGCLVGWYQFINGDEAGPVALVQLDSRKFEIFGESQIRIIKEVPNGQ